MTFISSSVDSLKYHLLVVDDDERLRNLLSRYLEEHGFHISVAESAKEAREALDIFQFDLIILDVMMAGETGIELTRDLQKSKEAPPILLLTAMGDLEDRINGLESGADEYLPKPFDPKELLLRIKAILKRTKSQDQLSPNKIQIGNFYFDIHKEQLYKGSVIVPLTSAEGNLLKVFSTRPGVTLSREELTELSGFDANPRTIDVQVTRLRRKIEDNPKLPQYLQTVRNKGYVLWTR